MPIQGNEDAEDAGRFPGEEETAAGAAARQEPAGSNPDDAGESGPWFVASVGIDGSFTRHSAVTFRLQAQADEWIRDNIERDQRLISLRMGNAFEARFVARQIEL